MQRHTPSSRRRFGQYLNERKRATASGDLGEWQGDKRPGSNRSKRSRSAIELFRGLWRQLSDRRAEVILALATLSIATALALVVPASTKIALDYILTDNPGPEGIPDWLGLPRDQIALLWILAGAMMAVTLASAAFGMWGRWRMTRLTKWTQASLRRRAFEHAAALPLHRVQDLRSGGAASLLREDAGGAGDLIFSLIYNPWRAITQLLGTLLILAVVDWRMLMGAILLIPIVWFTHRTWIARIRPVWRDIRRTRTGVDAHAAEVFAGMRVVRGFARQPAEAGRFSRENHFMARQEMLAWWRSRGIELVWQVMIPAASALVLLYGGWRVVRGDLTLGDVMMFSAYLLMLLGPLESLASSATAVQNNLAGFDRVLDLLHERREFEESAPQRDTRPVSRDSALGAVRVEAVSFSYPKSGREVLHNVSLDVEAGETIALIGPSGAGKTTLCNLIARFYDPDEGRVVFDGIDVRDIELDSYRRLLGIVEQDVFLFDGTIAQNIAYGRRGVSLEDVREAARVANIAEFIESLEDDYFTLIGERGVRLSGGQRQRLAIARAILADPVLLILDEATSNLDTESERLIQSGLEHLMRGRTTFVIAHRLSTIRHADRIVVLHDGRVVETGPHEQLIAQNGRYAQMLRLQLSDTDAREDDQRQAWQPGPAAG